MYNRRDALKCVPVVHCWQYEDSDMRRKPIQDANKVAPAGSQDLAKCAADLVGEAFVRYHAEFKAISDRAKARAVVCDAQ